MKIIYTGAFRFPCGDAAAARVIANAKILRDLGHDVEFLAWGGIQRKEDFREGAYFYQGFKYSVTDELDQRNNKIIHRIYAFINRGTKALELIKNKNADIIITYNSGLSFNKKLLAYCNQNNIKSITDITEWYAPEEFPGGKWTPIYWMSELNMRKWQKKFANKLLISSSLMKYFIGTNNLSLPPLIDLKDNKWENTLNSNILSTIPTHGRRIIFAGNPSNKDLLRNIIKALIILLSEGKKDIQLIILGLKEGSIDLYCNQDERNFLGNNLVNIGRVEQELVPAFYKISDASMIIRDSNRKNNSGFPTKMAESMAVGCPVIMTKTSDLNEFITDGANGIIIKDSSPKEIKEGLIRLSSLNNEELCEMKRLAQLTGKHKFDYRNYIPATLSFIDKLL